MNKNFSQLKSAFFKKNRNENNLKLEAVSVAIKYSPTYINEIELCHKNPDNIVWKQLFSAFDINLPEDDWMSIHLDEFNNFYEAMYYIKTDEINEYEKKLMNRSDFENSPLFYKYWILLFVHALHRLDASQAEIYLNKLQPYIKYFDQLDNYIFKIYTGSYYLLIGELDKAKELLIPMEKNNFNYKHFTAMLYYNLSYADFQLGEHVHSFRNIIKAKEIYIEEHNINRLCIVLGQEAAIYSEQGYYTEANALYLQAIDQLGYDKNNPILNISYINYSYCLIKQKNYKEALQMLDCCQSEYFVKVEYIFNRAWCLSKIGSKDECLDYIDKHKGFITRPYYQDCLNIIEILLNEGQTVNLKKKLNEVYLYDLSSDEKYFVLNLLLDYYKAKKNFKGQLETLETITGLRHNPR